MKRKIIIPIVIIVVLVGMGTKCIYSLVLENNVFDQMYYTRMDHPFRDQLWGTGNFQGMFANLKQLKDNSRHGYTYVTDFGVLHEDYMPGYLPDNTTLEIDFFLAPNEVSISYHKYKDKLNDQWDYKYYNPLGRG